MGLEDRYVVERTKAEYFQGFQGGNKKTQDRQVEVVLLKKYLQHKISEMLHVVKRQHDRIKKFR